MSGAATLPRAAIEAAIEGLIGLLDLIDGDADREDDDPDSDSTLLGEPDPSWGLPAPRYGIDQSRGVTNENEGWACYRRLQHAGLR